MLISLNNLKINSFKNVNKILTENTKSSDFKKNVPEILTYMRELFPREEN